MTKKDNKKKLPPFEQNKKNIKQFGENINLYQSALLLVEAAKALSIYSDDSELIELENMLKSTIIQFSEFLEERGDQWN